MASVVSINTAKFPPERSYQASLAAAQHDGRVPGSSCIAGLGTLGSTSASTPLPRLPRPTPHKPKGWLRPVTVPAAAPLGPPHLSTAPPPCRLKLTSSSPALSPSPSPPPPLAYPGFSPHPSSLSHPNTQHTLNSTGLSGRLKGEAGSGRRPSGPWTELAPRSGSTSDVCSGCLSGLTLVPTLEPMA